MTCDEVATSLGAYVLGALEPDEQTAVEQHLATCMSCREELSEISGLPTVLSRLTLDDVIEQPTPDDALFERLATQVDQAERRQQQSRRRRWLVAVAAALVLVAGGAGVGVWGATRTPHPSYAATAGSVHMNVALSSQTSGTAVDVTVSGLPADEHCTLVAVAKDGHTEVAGSWEATYEGQALQKGSTGIKRSSLARFVLLGTNGKPLVVVPV